MGIIAIRDLVLGVVISVAVILAIFASQKE